MKCFEPATTIIIVVRHDEMYYFIATILAKFIKHKNSSEG